MTGTLISLQRGNLRLLPLVLPKEIFGAMCGLLKNVSASNNIQQVGDLAQMVERMLSMHEAQGSIPWFSTLFWLFFSFLGGGAAVTGRAKSTPEPGIEPGSPA